MRPIVVLLITVSVVLFARENPFVPTPTGDVNAPPQQQVEESFTETEIEPIIPMQDPDLETTSDQTTEEMPTIEPVVTSGVKEVVNYEQARFVFRENSGYVETKDPLIKHFFISNPPSIVMDFKALSDFASKRKELNTAPFIKLEMGAHGDYYRVVFRLDKAHTYTIDKKRYGQVVTILD